MEASQKRGARKSLGHLPPFFIFYLLHASKISLDEIVAGLATAAGAAGFILRLESRFSSRFTSGSDWLGIALRRIPFRLATDCGWFLLVLWRYFLFRSSIEGRAVSIPFDAGKEDWVSASGRVWVLMLVSLIPNTVSINIGREKGRLLFHRLVDSGEKAGRRFHPSAIWGSS